MRYPVQESWGPPNAFVLDGLVVSMNKQYELSRQKSVLNMIMIINRIF